MRKREVETPGAPPDMIDSDDAEPEAPNSKRPKLASIMQVLKTNRAQELVRRLEYENGIFKTPVNRRQRRTNGLLERRMDVAEVYSPPRMARAARRHGLKGGWSLDLSVDDPDDGLPWDLSDPSKQQKAMKLLDSDKPALLVACPMCGPFSCLQNLNFSKRDPKTVEAEMTSALKHLKFTVDLCDKQWSEGRFFLFEHPMTSASWASEMLS